MITNKEKHRELGRRSGGGECGYAVEKNIIGFEIAVDDVTVMAVGNGREDLNVPYARSVPTPSCYTST